jgi:hypothetical protein
MKCRKFYLKVPAEKLIASVAGLCSVELQCEAHFSLCSIFIIIRS